MELFQIYQLFQATSTWGTVDASKNVMEASWRALVDSISYKLIEDGKQGGI